MKTKLIKLGLSQKVVDEIMEAFDVHQQSLKQYDKPKGPIQFHDNLKKIESLCSTLKQRLDSLSHFEKQLLNMYSDPPVFELTTGLVMLEFACQESRKKKIRFSRRDPLILTLTIDLWNLLERNGITVRKYKHNILCKVLTTLFPLPEPDQTEDVLPEDLWAFNLLRNASRRRVSLG